MIKQCETTFHRIKVNGKSYDIRSWECSCDFCGATAHKTGEDPGQAHERAWKEGFRPVSMGITRPMRWACATCSEKRVKGAAGKRVAPRGMGALPPPGSPFEGMEGKTLEEIEAKAKADAS